MNLRTRHVQKRWLLVAAALLMLVVLAGCGGGNESLAMAPVSTLPDYVQASPPIVQQAYQFAVANPDMLSHQPCYCGCGAMGHTSNLSCFISEISESGTITFDGHAANCGICVDIAQDVMRLTRDGKSQLEIRQYIDATYSPFGPSTDTPMPEV